MGDRWCVKWQFLKDVYFLMTEDIRFSSGKGGVRFRKMSRHLSENYRIELEPYKLKYLVWLVKMENKRKIRRK